MQWQSSRQLREVPIQEAQDRVCTVFTNSTVADALIRVHSVHFVPLQASSILWSMVPSWPTLSYIWSTCSCHLQLTARTAPQACARHGLASHPKQLTSKRILPEAVCPSSHTSSEQGGGKRCHGGNQAQSSGSGATQRLGLLNFNSGQCIRACCHLGVQDCRCARLLHTHTKDVSSS